MKSRKEEIKKAIIEATATDKIVSFRFYANQYGYNHMRRNDVEDIMEAVLKAVPGYKPVILCDTEEQMTHPERQSLFCGLHFVEDGVEFETWTAHNHPAEPSAPETESYDVDAVLNFWADWTNGILRINKRTGKVTFEDSYDTFHWNSKEEAAADALVAIREWAKDEPDALAFLLDNGIDPMLTEEEAVIEISRIAIRTETFCTPWNGQLYCIDVCEDSEERTAWLYNSNYGIKMLMFGEDVKNDRDQFLDAVFSNLPEYIESYHEDHEDAI